MLLLAIETRRQLRGARAVMDELVTKAKRETYADHLTKIATKYFDAWAFEDIEAAVGIARANARAAIRIADEAASKTKGWWLP